MAGPVQGKKKKREAWQFRISVAAAAEERKKEGKWGKVGWLVG